MSWVSQSIPISMAPRVPWMTLESGPLTCPKNLSLLGEKNKDKDGQCTCSSVLTTPGDEDKGTGHIYLGVGLS